METHVADLHAFLKYYYGSPYSGTDIAASQHQQQQRHKPIVIAHSFGGMLAMKYLEEFASQDTLIGYVQVFVFISRFDRSFIRNAGIFPPDCHHTEHKFLIVAERVSVLSLLLTRNTVVSRCFVVYHHPGMVK